MAVRLAYYRGAFYMVDDMHLQWPTRAVLQAGVSVCRLSRRILWNVRTVHEF